MEDSFRCTATIMDSPDASEIGGWVEIMVDILSGEGTDYTWDWWFV
jgi:hypothetical protein